MAVELRFVGLFVEAIKLRLPPDSRLFEPNACDAKRHVHRLVRGRLMRHHGMTRDDLSDAPFETTGVAFYVVGWLASDGDQIDGMFSRILAPDFQANHPEEGR